MCIVAFFDEPKKAVIALVYYVVYQQLENYVVAPRIMQRTVSVPGAVTVVAALAGGTLLGVLGALLAIPVAAGCCCSTKRCCSRASPGIEVRRVTPVGISGSAASGRRRSRWSQQTVCQCRRWSAPPTPSAGHATTWAVPGRIAWSHPGQR